MSSIYNRAHFARFGFYPFVFVREYIILNFFFPELFVKYKIPKFT